MKNIVSLLILLAAVIAAHPQTPKKLIFWSGDKGCGIKSRAITAQDVISCDSLVTERGPVSTISYNGISLAAAFLEDDDYNLVAAQITNSTDEVLLFDSDLWGAAHFRTKAGFYAGERPILAETSIPSRDIVRGLSQGVKMESSLDTFIADGQKTNETKELRRPDGTKIKVDVIVPDKEAQQAAMRQNAIRMEMTSGSQRGIRSTALTAKSIPVGGSVRGLVYFRREKKVDFVVYSISIEDITFVFQLPRNKK